MTRSILTDKKNRAKCLAYRNGKRCGRKATVLMTRSHDLHSRVVCQECADRQASEGASVKQVNRAGFNVISHSMSGWHSRDYTPIEA